MKVKWPIALARKNEMKVINLVIWGHKWSDNNKSVWQEQFIKTFPPDVYWAPEIAKYKNARNSAFPLFLRPKKTSWRFNTTLFPVSSSVLIWSKCGCVLFWDETLHYTTKTVITGWGYLLLRFLFVWLCVCVCELCPNVKKKDRENS